MTQWLDDYEECLDDEFVEDEYDEGFIVMTEEEFIEWCDDDMEVPF